MEIQMQREAQRGGVVEQWGERQMRWVQVSRMATKQTLGWTGSARTAATHAESTLQKWNCRGRGMCAAFVHGAPIPLSPGPPSLPLLSLFLFLFSSFSPLPMFQSFLSPGDSRAAPDLPRGKLSKYSAQGLHPCF